MSDEYVDSIVFDEMVGVGLKTLSEVIIVFGVVVVSVMNEID